MSEVAPVDVGCSAAVETPQTAVSTAAVVAALAAISITWGSTYLAYKQVLQVAPPFLLAASRFLIGGALLVAWAGRRSGVLSSVNRSQIRNVAIAAFVIFIGSTASVVWSQQYLSSSLAGLLAGTVPLSTTVVGWFLLGERPGGAALVGLGVGFVGLATLVGFSAWGVFDAVPIAVALFGMMAWAVGSAYSRRVAMPSDPMLTAGLQMVAGGIFLALLGVATGELGDVVWSEVHPTTVLWFLHLAVPCTLTYGTYVWLLDARGMTTASSYAYLMPVVAVLLGWLVLSDPVTTATLVGGGLIVAGVALVVRSKPPGATTVGS